jgi:hypothetical protein
MSYNLKCTHNIIDDVIIQRGRMSYCQIASSPHWFILVESGKYRCGAFIPNYKKIIAFSYVPDATYNYINDKYKDKTDFLFIKSPGDSVVTTLVGYLPFLFTTSHVLDTWKLTDEYTVIKTQPVKNWSYRRFPEFKLYNLLSLVPWFGITDCIGYSNHHFLYL